MHQSGGLGSTYRNVFHLRLNMIKYQVAVKNDVRNRRVPIFLPRCTVLQRFDYPLTTPRVDVVVVEEIEMKIAKYLQLFRNELDISIAFFSTIRTWNA